MDVLVEVHDAAEMDRAARLKSRLIGINNRDLRTFETDIADHRGSARAVPADRMLVSESGLAHARRSGDDGTRRRALLPDRRNLMRQDDVEAATREILRAPWSPQAG